MEGVVRRNQHSATLINDAGQLVGPSQFDLRHPLSLQCSATHRSKQPKPPWSQFGWPKSRRNAVRLIVHGRAKKAISVSMQSALFCRFLCTKSIVIRAVLLHSISYYFDTTRFCQSGKILQAPQRKLGREVDQEQVEPLVPPYFTKSAFLLVCVAWIAKMRKLSELK